MIDARSIPSISARRSHGARSSGWRWLPNWMSMCSWKRPGTWLYVTPFVLSSGSRLTPKVGLIASTAPRRIA